MMKKKMNKPEENFDELIPKKWVTYTKGKIKNSDNLHDEKD